MNNPSSRNPNSNKTFLDGFSGLPRAIEMTVSQVEFVGLLLFVVPELHKLSRLCKSHSWWSIKVIRRQIWMTKVVPWSLTSMFVRLITLGVVDGDTDIEGTDLCRVYGDGDGDLSLDLRKLPWKTKWYWQRQDWCLRSWNEMQKLFDFDELSD